MTTIRWYEFGDVASSIHDAICSFKKISVDMSCQHWSFRRLDTTCFAEPPAEISRRQDFDATHSRELQSASRPRAFTDVAASMPRPAHLFDLFIGCLVTSRGKKLSDRFQSISHALSAEFIVRPPVLGLQMHCRIFHTRPQTVFSWDKAATYLRSYERRWKPSCTSLERHYDQPRFCSHLRESTKLSHRNSSDCIEQIFWSISFEISIRPTAAWSMSRRHRRAVLGFDIKSNTIFEDFISARIDEQYWRGQRHRTLFSLPVRRRHRQCLSTAFGLIERAHSRSSMRIPEFMSPARSDEVMTAWVWKPFFVSIGFPIGSEQPAPQASMTENVDDSRDGETITHQSRTTGRYDASSSRTSIESAPYCAHLDVFW